MLSINEARARAGALWGHERLIHLELRPDGGVDVELKPSAVAAHDNGDVGMREHTYSYHRLDGDGHAICHHACILLEAGR